MPSRNALCFVLVVLAMGAISCGAGEDPSTQKSRSASASPTTMAPPEVDDAPAPSTSLPMSKHERVRALQNHNLPSGGIGSVCWGVQEVQTLFAEAGMAQSAKEKSSILSELDSSMTLIQQRVEASLVDVPSSVRPFVRTFDDRLKAHAPSIEAAASSSRSVEEVNKSIGEIGRAVDISTFPAVDAFNSAAEASTACDVPR